MPAVIANPIINSPFTEPERHFKFDDDGITDEILSGRRPSGYFIPIARPRSRGRIAQTELWTEDRYTEARLVNEIRHKLTIWRAGGYAGITRTTARLLDYWRAPDRERPLFFCQIEALETLIYITEVAGRYGDQWIENDLRKANADANPLLYRVACKMATGSGKTVVMAMIIAWHTLNKIANPQDARFSDTFLLVAPGITIRDRLRVLLPNDLQNYYRERDLVPAGNLREDLLRAKILITNFHAFKLREKNSAARITKAVLAGREGDASAFTETPAEMVRRVCKDLAGKKNIIVLNDEAHHCYRRRAESVEAPASPSEKLTGDDRREAEKRDEEARIWISGLEAVKDRLGIRAVYDLSATPFFLRGSGYQENLIFPWVVSDFSLIDAIECGIVKVPRVPVADDAMAGEQPTYRDLWLRIRDDLPKKGRKSEAVSGEPKLPAELQGALHSLYSNYEKAYQKWETAAANGNGHTRGTPPVFIVVCNNTNVSKLVFDYIAGWEKRITDCKSVVVPGALPIFRNDDGHGAWLHRPNTILIDSTQLDSGDALSTDFKKLVAREIDEFKHELRARFPGRDVTDLTDEDLLREVMNTVGKAGKLGEQVRCVVSVSMLTEGWDANTVTHILGVRAFGTQLLCEQVVGRGLRRMSYDPQLRQIDANGEQIEILAYEPEYAEVYGVPFSFIPTSGSNPNPTPGPQLTHVRAIDSRAACEITFPRVVGYRYQLPAERLNWKFNADSRLPLSARDVPTWTQVEPIVGEASIHTLEDLQRRRPQEVAFLLAKLVLEKYFPAEAGDNTDNGLISSGSSLNPNENSSCSDTAPQNPGGVIDCSHGFQPVDNPRQQAHLDSPRGESPRVAPTATRNWLFPQLLAITRRWLAQCVVYGDHTFPQLLLLIEQAHHAADRIYRSIVAAESGEKRLMPILPPYDALGSTRHVDFDTARPVWATAEDKCHINYVVADTQSWEQKLALELERHPRVLRYVKNQHLGFSIPYTLNGEEHQYIPDFIAVLDDGHGPDNPLNLILEVTGEKKKDKEAKVATAKTLWVPAVNNTGEFGRWGFVEVNDPWNLGI